MKILPNVIEESQDLTNDESLLTNSQSTFPSLFAEMSSTPMIENIEKSFTSQDQLVRPLRNITDEMSSNKSKTLIPTSDDRFFDDIDFINWLHDAENKKNETFESSTSSELNVEIQ